MTAGILGATGYSGRLLFRFLMAHPGVTRVAASSRSRAGLPVMDIIPEHLTERASGGTYCSPDELLGACERSEIDVLFSALPHGASAEAWKHAATANKKLTVIDLSADFRFSDAQLYKHVYGHDLADAALARRACYGLSEWNREAIAKAGIIACPGCYPTSALLPLLPVLRYVRPSGLISIASYSGISGAGQALKPNLLFSERNESIAPYSPGTKHRHLPEILAGLKAFAHVEEFDDAAESSAHGAGGGNSRLQWNRAEYGESAPVVFMPHLAPMTRGIMTTITVPLAEGDAERAVRALAAQYANEAWVHVLDENTMPDTANTRGSNAAHIGFAREQSCLILCCAIDNLVKGASGQAVQNFNIKFGFAETDGLPLYET